MNIKLKHVIFQCDVWVSGTFIALGLDSKVGSTNNICFDIIFTPFIEPYINMGYKAARPQRQRRSSGKTVLILSELEKSA